MATILPAAATRQPFAPINGARLQNLTSLKNRQNALPTTLTSPSKRKVTDYEEDFENIDPIVFSPKRAKGLDGIDFFKPSASHFVLTSTSSTFKDFAKCSPVKSTVSRPMLQPRSPVPKLNTTAASTLSAPAGRSPTRKRIGILNRRRTASPFTRIDPPKFTGPVANAPFSIAAALSGTIPSYGARQSRSASQTSIPRSLLEPEQKSGWFFDIHEDTIEETMTNLMEHSTCTLDISSDEETEARRRDERGKENVPPLDDISQTSSRLPYSTSSSYDSFMDAKARARSTRRRREVEEGAIDIDRSPLSDLAAEEFYAEGCTSSDVVFVADDEAEAEAEIETEVAVEAAQEPGPLGEQLPEQLVCTFDFSVEIPLLDAQVATEDKGKGKDVDELMMKSDSEAPTQAVLFEPLEKAEVGFEVWESASAKGDD